MRRGSYAGRMKGWTPRGNAVTLTDWQESAVRALLNPYHQQVIPIRGRQWGWSTVMETARRYDLHPELLHGQAGDPVFPVAAMLGPPPVS